MDERFLRYIGLPAAVAASVGLTWDTFTGLDLIPRLIATLALAVLAQEILARSLAPDPPAPEVGFTPKQQGEATSYWRFAVSAVAILVCSSIFAGLAWLQTERLVITASRDALNGSQSLHLSASWEEADHITLSLPPPPVECNIREVGASLTEIDWDQPDRTLRIDNFVSPQSVTVICNTPTLISERDIQVVGSSDGPYFESDLIPIKFAIFAIGVALCLYGLFRLRKLS
ncbi:MULTISPECIES: hypothetical protein [unclassified Roseitalea]|uniref:hypothetical protein n=1 Tax=unclassified Roseitalea TaxID=2639107 RepID=UPI00273D5AA3|nr:MULTISPECIES: hypothetical protein [unclassified Roseitalea]